MTCPMSPQETSSASPFPPNDRPKNAERISLDARPFQAFLTVSTSREARANGLGRTGQSASRGGASEIGGGRTLSSCAKQHADRARRNPRMCVLMHTRSMYAAPDRALLADLTEAERLTG